MKIKIFTIPNLLTCSHLFCGCVGVVAVYHSDLKIAAWMIFLAGVFDFLDGFVARLLKSASALGQQLDSLADMVTFGLLPGCIISYYLTVAVPTIEEIWISYLAFIITIFSALRLAKFNIDTRQSDSFIGLPTPANAMVVASFPLIIDAYPSMNGIIINTTHLLLYVGIFSFLLIAEIPLIALKFKDFSWKNNSYKYVLILVSLLLFSFFSVLSIPIIVLFYISLSLLYKFTNQNKI